MDVSICPPAVLENASMWCRIKKKERRPGCLTVLKTDVAAAAASLGGAAAVLTPGDAQRADQAVARAVARAKALGERDRLYRVSLPITEKEQDEGTNNIPLPLS
jgi:hypothetical protein